MKVLNETDFRPVEGGRYTVTIRMTDPTLPTRSTSCSHSNDEADKGIDEHK